MAKVKVSISDIAKSLNISKTTVSFIINGRAKENRISDELVRKVQEKVDELGYKPNHFAKSLRTGKTKIIGLMVEDISNPFFGIIARKIEEKAYKNGYKIVYCSTDNDQERARNFLQMFLTLGVDGCIIAPTINLESDLENMVKSGVEVVLFDRKFDNVLADTVMIDNQLGVYQAVKHLKEQGRQKIGFVGLVLSEEPKEERIKGYKRAVADFGLESLLFTFSFHHDTQVYVERIKEIIQANPQLDALIFGTNYLGISGLEAVNSLNLSIPDQMALVSFDEHDLFRIHKPGITIIAQPMEEIAQFSIELLLDRLENKDNNRKPKVEKVLDTLLIARGSSSGTKAS